MGENPKSYYAGLLFPTFPTIHTRGAFTVLLLLQLQRGLSARQKKPSSSAVAATDASFNNQLKVLGRVIRGGNKLSLFGFRSCQMNSLTFFFEK